ncbi:MAG: hypothetical protein QG673_1547 [Pseudomonadota bacterium]|nr:hypothetical protein [Pseudomonadota bacterium]
MRKILFSLLAIGGASAFAATDYSQFQAFDDEVSVGWGMKQDTVTAIGGGENNTSSSNIVNLEGERLLNNGIWIDVNAGMTFGQGSTSTNGAQEPVISDYGVNGKVGYAFQVADTHLLLTPYGLAGLNNNGIADGPLNGIATSTSSTTTSNQFYYTAGVGGRIEYRINTAILVFADQNAAYNWDQTGYNNGIQPQNMYAFTSTLGVKFNIVKDFQVGVKGFYTSYQPDSSSGTASGVAYPQAQSTVGGLVSIGLTY